MTDAERTARRKELEAEIAGKVCARCRSVPRIAWNGREHVLLCNCIVATVLVPAPTAADYVRERGAAMEASAANSRAHPRSAAEIEEDMRDLFDTENG